MLHFLWSLARLDLVNIFLGSCFESQMSILYAMASEVEFHLCSDYVALYHAVFEKDEDKRRKGFQMKMKK